jgi:hypothetical protein
MTDSPAARLTLAARRAQSVVASVLHSPRRLAAVALVIAGVGTLAVLTGHTGTAILAVLALQLVIIVAVIAHGRRSTAALDQVTERLRHSDARIAGDIARLRLTLTTHDADSKDH